MGNAHYHEHARWKMCRTLSNFTASKQKNECEVSSISLSETLIQQYVPEISFIFKLSLYFPIKLFLLPFVKCKLIM